MSQGEGNSRERWVLFCAMYFLLAQEYLWVVCDTVSIISFGEDSLNRLGFVSYLKRFATNAGHSDKGTRRFVTPSQETCENGAVHPWLLEEWFSLGVFSTKWSMFWLFGHFSKGAAALTDRDNGNPLAGR